MLLLGLPRLRRDGPTLSGNALLNCLDHSKADQTKSYRTVPQSGNRAFVFLRSFLSNPFYEVIFHGFALSCLGSHFALSCLALDIKLSSRLQVSLLHFGLHSPHTDDNKSSFNHFVRQQQ